MHTQDGLAFYRRYIAKCISGHVNFRWSWCIHAIIDNYFFVHFRTGVAFRYLLTIHIYLAVFYLYNGLRIAITLFDDDRFFLLFNCFLLSGFCLLFALC